jgi:hypothetical protein
MLVGGVMEKDKLIEALNGLQNGVLLGWQFFAGPATATRSTRMRMEYDWDFFPVVGDFRVKDDDVILHQEGFLCDSDRTEYTQSNSFGCGVSWIDHATVALLVWASPCMEGEEMMRGGISHLFIRSFLKDRIKGIKDAEKQLGWKIRASGG